MTATEENILETIQDDDIMIITITTTIWSTRRSVDVDVRGGRLFPQGGGLGEDQTERIKEKQKNFKVALSPPHRRMTTCSFFHFPVLQERGGVRPLKSNLILNPATCMLLSQNK
ncbi:hypothetical protein CEXT_23271 [Caerostris extrusa]|uniref:Uncharacterized protein n=1 Tax=Caerostris extrusa TaxID=172846 RepID=A0AAV4XV16_CAEEX|nr:hypothetical protein CEXT_23271 [Caerostris extrusa]